MEEEGGRWTSSWRREVMGGSKGLCFDKGFGIPSLELFFHTVPCWKHLASPLGMSSLFCWH